VSSCLFLLTAFTEVFHKNHSLMPVHFILLYFIIIIFCYYNYINQFAIAEVTQFLSEQFNRMNTTSDFVHMYYSYIQVKTWGMLPGDHGGHVLQLPFSTWGSKRYLFCRRITTSAKWVAAHLRFSVFSLTCLETLCHSRFRHALMHTTTSPEVY
jgi:hypothetical protein